MSHSDIIIIGAGASGLMAARELIKRQQNVVVLEARDRVGGRIHTLNDPSFPQPVELGAEFIHGDLPVTQQLLADGKIDYYPFEGEMLQVPEDGEKQESFHSYHWQLFEKELSKLKEDITIEEFLDKHFQDQKYSGLRKSVTGFVEGYDAADATYASCFALRDEWLQEDSHQYRVQGGYGRPMDFLSDYIIAGGGTIHLSAIVKEINWKPGLVSVITADGKRYTAAKAVITVPLGVLQKNETIHFSPAIPDKIEATRSMGYGSVIKILLSFTDIFWHDEEQKKRFGNTVKHLGFIFSDAPVPTWWTQSPHENGLLTGWLAGPKAMQWATMSDEAILEEGLSSLSSIFKIPPTALAKKLSSWRIANWGVDPFACGAYHYATLTDKQARAALAQPVAATLFFSGEALYKGKEFGTVEAALASGLQVAKTIMG